MAFETPLTVADVIERIQEGRYTLPAIQREFVWKPDQISRLFDSLLTGYPIGSFLFWAVKGENADAYDFYDFIRDYHERDATHNQKAKLVPGRDLTAVLDGQQRLTALYIGLAGTHSSRRAKARKANPNAYPKRRLYLCLTQSSSDEEARYAFAFRDDSDDIVQDDAGKHWLRVGAVLGLSKFSSASPLLAKAGLGNDLVAVEIAERLRIAVHVDQVISHYLVKEQDLDHVLDVFVRVNSGGTKLSHSDLLLSIATSQWDKLDARETIYELVDDINKQGRWFDFDKDFVLKCCLMVADLETRFSTTNFTAANMKKIEGRWSEIEAAIRSTVDLLVSFGLSADTLRSANAVVPLVYYMAQRGSPAGFAQKSVYATERTAMRRWLLAALLTRAFTGQPDSILRIVRDELKAHSGEGSFPADAIVKALDRSQRPMRIGEEDLDRFLDEEYGSGYEFATLGLLYPTLDLRNLFHVDHVHPQASFTSARLAKAGITSGVEQASFRERRDRIANLQLLAGTLNQEKSGRPLADWLDHSFGKATLERQSFMALHYLPDVDLVFSNFLGFYEARRELMKARLRVELGLPADGSPKPPLNTSTALL